LKKKREQEKGSKEKGAGLDIGQTPILGPNKPTWT